MTGGDLATLSERLRKFAEERGWVRFHTPKNLASALSVEAAELLEVFQWMTPDESNAVMLDDGTRGAVLDEIADVLIYLVRLADVLELDLVTAALSKVDRNELRFPRT